MSLAVIPSKEEMSVIEIIAKAAADSKHFDKLGGYAGILSICLYSREIGMPPLAALYGGMHNIQGKISMSSEMMMSLIRKQGHKIEILEATALNCRVRGTRKDTGESYTACFNFEDAKRAGLVKAGGAFEKHPSDMLFARATGQLKRRLFPDIAAKAYIEGELEDEEDEAQKAQEKESDVIEVVAEVKEPQVKAPLKMNADDAAKIRAVLGDDSDFEKNVFEHYAKKYKTAVKSFTDINDSEYDTIWKRAKAYAKERLEAEMNIREAANDE